MRNYYTIFPKIWQFTGISGDPTYSLKGYGIREKKQNKNKLILCWIPKLQRYILVFPGV